MQSVDTVTKRSMLAIIPPYFKAMPYVKVVEGDIKTINHVVYSVYPVKDKETREPMIRRDGSVVTNVTAYIGFDDGTYTTSHGSTVINQLVSETGNFEDVEGYYEFADLNCKVKIIKTNEQSRSDKNKSWPVWAFEPLA